jgi:hypothetical protein
MSPDGRGRLEGAGPVTDPPASSTRLAASLPDPPPSLDRERAAELGGHAEAALLRRRRELDAAIELAFAQVPAPLRRVARRILGA